MMSRSRTNPKLSAYEAQEGTFDFNATPLVPPVTRALIYIPTGVRASWAPRGEDAYYTGPAMEHYRSWRFFVVDTDSFRISSSAKFYPTHCQMPTTSNALTIQQAAEDLLQALQNPHPGIPTSTNSRHVGALKELTSIFKQAANPEATDTESETEPVTDSEGEGEVPNSEGGGK